MEDRLAGLWVVLIELYGTVVELWVLIVEQTDDFCACPQSRPVAMCGEDVDGSVVVEGGVEGHTCADAGALYLTLCIDF